jgi:ferritin-like metal-binding protein YciE
MHLRETEQQVNRLDRIIGSLGHSRSGKTCQAMKGLVAEGQEAIDANGSPSVKDAALIAAAQRVEHYEIAAYGTAKAFARRLRKDGVVQLLEQTLTEEKKADQKLNQLAETDVNIQAATV